MQDFSGELKLKIRALIILFLFNYNSKFTPRPPDGEKVY